MKMSFLSKRSTAILLLAPLLSQAQTTTIQIDNLRTFQGIDAITSEPISQFSGAADLGILTVSPNAPLFPTGNIPSPSDQAQFRISDLNLDGVGINDDYIEFTVRYEAARDGSSGLVNWSGSGIGVQGDLSPGNAEALTVSIVNVYLSPGTTGAATFDGFSSAGIYLGGAGITTNGQVDVNGTSYSDTFDATAGFTFNIGETNLSDSPTVVVDNVQTSDGDFRLRTVDFSITYDPDATPPPNVVDLTSSALNLRKDATYIYTPNGGANLGSIVAPQGFDATAIAASPETDLRLRWEGLNLERDGTADDYFEFTLRATTGTENNIYFSGLGIGGGGFGIENDEVITFEIVDITPKPGLSGTIAFDGFTGGGTILSGNAELETSTGQGQIDINGVTLMDTLSGNANSPGFVSKVISTDFEAPAPTLVFTNGINDNAPADTIVVALHARDFDLSFTTPMVNPISKKSSSQTPGSLTAILSSLNLPQEAQTSK
jgi:hypothetical protein